MNIMTRNTDSDNFKKLFAGLHAVTQGQAGRAGRSVPVFRVLTDPMPPRLVLAERKGTPAPNAPEAKLMAELDRLGYMEGDFGWDQGDAGQPGASLWENPHLVYLLQGCREITDGNGNAISVSDARVRPLLDIKGPWREPDGDGEKETMATVRLVLRTPAGDLADPVYLTDTHVLAGDAIYTVPSAGPNYTSLSGLLQPVPRDILEGYLSLMLSFVTGVGIEYNGLAAHISKTPVHAVPTLVLEKVAPDRALYLRVLALPEGETSAVAGAGQLTSMVSVDERGEVTVRNVETQGIDGAVERLEDIVARNAPTRQARKDIYREDNFFIIPAETASPFLLNSLPEVLSIFQLLGSEKLKEYKVTPAQPKLNLRLSSGIDFLEGDADVSVGGESFSLADFLTQYRKNRYVQLSDGNRAIVDEKYINRLQRLFNRRDKKGNIKVSLFDLPEVEELIQSKVSGEFAQRTRKVFEGFNRLAKERAPQPEVNATLRPYQEEGVKWLRYLCDNKLGGCLADDMGLGKTLQTISLLSFLYPASEKPTLIVMPRSLLFNWEKEFARFAPGIRTATYYGTDRNLEKSLAEGQVLLTTYAVVRNDIEQLRGVRFEYVILDESQNIKNVEAQTTQAVMMLEADHRLALSGTPMENNLTEIYSLFRFLNPTMFGTLEDFNSLYTYPIQKHGDQEATRSLRRRIFPFLLRRLKKDVLDDLPDRIDQTLYVEMSAAQKEYYDQKRRAFREEINTAIARDGVQKSQLLMFQALNELRRIASVPESMTDGRIASPKITDLLESLSAAVGNGHKAVVFFNYIAGIELVGARLEEMGIACETMTGSTTAAARKRIVERFQTDPQCRVLMMTLKVGGVGLNLTAADTVYIFEPWWNRAAEEQAVNRLHRIGQKATVNAYSMITVGTIEEKILQLQEQKSQLFNDLINADSASPRQLSAEDIDFILS